MSEYYEGPTYGIRDRQRDKPASPVCAKCGTLISHKETYYTDGSNALCRTCVEDRIEDLLKVSFDMVAETLGYDPVLYDAREE